VDYHEKLRGGCKSSRHQVEKVRACGLKIRIVSTRELARALYLLGEVSLSELLAPCCVFFFEKGQSQPLHQSMYTIVFITLLTSFTSSLLCVSIIHPRVDNLRVSRV
jgi:hypothetical protein